MSEKNNKIYRYVWRNLERNALEHYEWLSFFHKIKYGFNKKKYVKWYCVNNKQSYPYLIKTYKRLRRCLDD